MKSNKKIICLSGGADPLRACHVKMIQDAAEYGKVIFILNSSQWLERKKGYCLMSWDERAEILRAFQEIYDVEPVDDLEGTVSEALIRIKPHFFGKGGPSTYDSTPESKLCDQLGIELVFGLGGDKAQSSTELVDAVVKSIINKINRWK